MSFYSETEHLISTQACLANEQFIVLFVLENTSKNTLITMEHHTREY